jgi:hypothetical protein
MTETDARVVRLLLYVVVHDLHVIAGEQFAVAIVKARMLERDRAPEEIAPALRYARACGWLQSESLEADAMTLTEEGYRIGSDPLRDQIRL